MNAKERGRNVRGVLVALALLGTSAAGPALAQKGRKSVPSAPAASPAPAPGEGPKLVMKAVPVNPTDPIAVINGEIITRAQLADECIARKGQEILDTLIARKLIDQGLRAHKMEVTPAEVDAEIDNVAARVAGIGREAWLRTLDKERGISPVQYARDIIYPALALRKLAKDRVQVTPKDMRDSFEAQYGDKLRCRMIMVDKVQTAKEIWEELRKNPGGFEKLAMERSMDQSSRSLGGQLAEPISRHAFPQTVSDAAFAQLVDGDAKDTDPTHKPKDGDFTGPIQVAEATWVLLRRERLEPAGKVDPNDERVKKNTYEMIYEVKLKEAMGGVMGELMRVAAVDNKLTGKTKLANEMDVDQEVMLMGGKPSPDATPSATARPVPNPNSPRPAALSPEVVKQTEALTRPSAKK